MSTETTGIVHKLNELIAEIETRAIHADQSISQTTLQSKMESSIVSRDHYRRALGQLKAARTSIMSANHQEAA
jgi:hypothetical protein